MPEPSPLEQADALRQANEALQEALVTLRLVAEHLGLDLDAPRPDHLRLVAAPPTK